VSVCVCVWKLRINLAQCLIMTLRTRKDSWGRSQRPRGLRRGSTAVHFIACGEGGGGLNPAGVMDVSCECVLSVEVSANGRTLVQSSPTECECVI